MKELRILCLSDEPDRAYWDFFDKDRLKDIDLIISCGDLPSEYLSFLATFFNGPLLYVPGNHDEKYLRKPPEGCINIDGKVFVYEGVRIAGLGGSVRYKEGPFMYSQSQMYKRVYKLYLQIWRKKGIDILVTHAPAKGLNDLPDLPHTGFDAFIDLIDRFHPKYLIHGHVHLSYSSNPRILHYEGTTIINAYQKYILDYKLD
jgi:Icc-related predicted phosphoesterase